MGLSLPRVPTALNADTSVSCCCCCCCMSAALVRNSLRSGDSVRDEASSPGAGGSMGRLLSRFGDMGITFCGREGLRGGGRCGDSGGTAPAPPPLSGEWFSAGAVSDTGVRDSSVGRPAAVGEPVTAVAAARGDPLPSEAVAE